MAGEVESDIYSQVSRYTAKFFFFCVRACVSAWALWNGPECNGSYGRHRLSKKKYIKNRKRRFLNLRSAGIDAYPKVSASKV